MVHAETLQTLHPAAGATAAVVDFVSDCATPRSPTRCATTRGAICSTPSAS